MSEASASTPVDVQIVGGGRMGEALLSGLLAADPSRRIRVVEALAARADELRSAHPSIEVADAPGPAAGTVLAVKPHQIVDVCGAVAAADGGRVLSIAAGVTIATIEDALPAGTPVVRAMPNTPALVGQGAAAIAPGANASEADVDWAEAILGAVGSVARVPEHLLDAVTGLSGSGPAYVFVVLDALIEGGVAAGLPRETAESLAGQTLLGAASLYLAGDKSPGELRAQVTSPGGTTAAGLRVLEQRAVRSALIDAVIAARDRSIELS
ncbi:pyrroline-5-carboxylate reductase [Actinospongicola halichondriae]|uniref:pyrroline-5-carboxylate reductase n=1 Tax=Actinospongicola halichondriae TaxID=3236844 RepID=UPI003D3C3193